MSEELLVTLAIPFAMAVAAIFIKFIVLCQQAREEEFEMRRRAVAVAASQQSENAFGR